MAEKKKGVLDDLGLGSDKKSSDTKGKKGKTSTAKMVGYGLGGVVALYLGYRLYENYEANSAANAANTAATTAYTAE